MRALAASVLVAASLGAQQRPAYLDESLPFEQRARDLVSRMTLEEKVMQMKDVAPANVTLPLAVSSLAYWNESKRGWEVECETVRLLVGASSADIRARTTIDVVP